MPRPVSPSPRHSQDLRPVTPPSSHTTQLRRSSSDASSRPNRFLAKLKNAGGVASNSASSIAAAANSTLTSALTLPASSSSSTGSSGGLRANTSPKLSNFHSAQMHRLGAHSAQAAAALAPAMANPASMSSLSLASTLTNTTITNAQLTTDPWHMLHVNVLPLFNGEPLRMHIEGLNLLVKKHIASVLLRSLSPIQALEQDITSLLARGMTTLNVKLVVSDDKELLSRACDAWEQFWRAILPYIEGIFLPFRTEKLLQSSTRTPKTNQTSSSSFPSLDELSHQPIDIRLISLRSFRDSILLPIYPRIHTLLSSLVKDKDPIITNAQPPFPQLQQMLLVLFSISQPSHTCVSSTTPSPGENAVTHLLRAIRSPRAAVAFNHKHSGPRYSSSFFSGSAPRDRRGRIARRSAHYSMTLNLKKKESSSSPSRDRDENGDYNWDDDTPRNPGFSGGDEREREREKKLLESLRSPEMDNDAGVDASVDERTLIGSSSGGWGLGRGHEARRVEDDDDEAAKDLDGDQAQHVVERMVGLRA